MDRIANGKRKKSAGEAAAAAAHASIVPPRFISCKMMRTSLAPRPVTPGTAACTEPPPKASFAALPREMFCNVIAYLGPTSSALCALSQVSREHNAIMRSIGDVMYQRARLRFRTPLPPKSGCESSVSIFVRHARVSKAVHDKLETIDTVLSKDFPIIDTSQDSKPPYDYLPQSPGSSSSLSIRVGVEPCEVINALNIALCLMGCPKKHYFDDFNEAGEIAKNAATTALEWRVSSLCSKLGAKAYKYAKSRMCLRYEREDELFSAYAVTDEMSLEEDEGSDYDEYEEEAASLDSGLEIDEDIAMLDKASLVMQHVVLRAREKQHQARPTGQATQVPKSTTHTLPVGNANLTVHT
ncbi:hypothetical protein ACHAXT_000789 [Thalassiosira profunda]